MLLMLGLAPLFLGLRVKQEGADADDAGACSLFLGRWVKQKGPDAADARACSPLSGALGETGRR